MKVKSEQIPAGTPCDCEPCPNDATVGLLSRGATGRWCEVMWVCETCANKMCDGKIWDAAEARQWVSDQGPPNRPDF